MNSTSEDIKDFLDDSSAELDLVFGTNLFIGMEPETPDECVTIYDTGGFDPSAAMSYDYPTIQVRVRGNPGEYTEAYDLIASIKDFLHGKTNITTGGTRYIAVWGMGDIITLGYDESRRPLLTMNFRIHRTE